MSSSLILPNGFALVGRREWGGGDPRATNHRGGALHDLRGRRLKRARLHHSVTNSSHDPCRDFRAVAQVLDQRRLAGYNWFAHPSGVLGELQGTRMGEHTKDHNTDSVAFCLVGNYDRDQPSLLQLVNIARAINLLIIDGTLAGWQDGLQVVPHADTSATACPGYNVREAVISGRTGSQWVTWFGTQGV